jgi:hypothetical protein
MLGNYQIEFNLVFLNVKNIILKLYINPIIWIEACDVFNSSY